MSSNDPLVTYLDEPVAVVTKLLEGYILQRPSGPYKLCEIVKPLEDFVAFEAPRETWMSLRYAMANPQVFPALPKLVLVHLTEPETAGQWAIVHEGNAEALRWKSTPEGAAAAAIEKAMQSSHPDSEDGW